MKKIKISLFLIAMLLILVPMEVMAADSTLNSIKLNRDEFTLNVGETKVIQATTTPSDASKKNIEFKSSSSSATVAKITKGVNVESDGKLTAGNKIYYLQSRICENVISVAEGKTNNSTNIVMNKYTNADSQKFELIDAGNGYYLIRIKHSGKFLDIKNSKKSNGTNVIQYKLTGNDNQLWQLEDAGDGYYFIKSKHSGKYLDIRKGSKQEGAELIIYDKNSNNNQKFKFVDTGETAKVEEFGLAKVTAKKNGKSNITASISGITSNKCKVTVITKVTGVSLSTEDTTLYLNQSKIIEANIKPSTASDKSVTFTSSNEEIAKVEKVKVKGRYYLKSALNDKVISIKDDSTSNSATVVIQDNGKKGSQKFDFIDAGNGYYIIRVKHSGKVLDVQRGGKTNSTKVIQYKLTGADNQLWKLEDAGDGYYYIKSKHSGLYLDIQGGKSENGKNIIIYQGKQSNNQKFKLDPINENTDNDVMGLAKVTAKEEGNVTITATTSNGLTASFNLSSQIAVTSITLDKKNVTLSDKKVTLNATVKPDEATDKTVTWTSSDTKVATVKKGVITAVAPGEATITAKTSNGKKATCTVIVTTNVLFIGNSKTYYNKMPVKYFAQMAEKAGKSVHVETITAAGQTLKWHYDNRESDEVIRESGTNLAKTVTSKRWDYVVLQEKTDTSYKDSETMKSGITSIVNFMKNNGSKNVKPIYNAIWMDITDARNSCSTVNDTKKLVIKSSSSPYNLQLQANENYSQIMDSLGGTIAYSGKAFIECWKDSAGFNLQLYREADDDWNHPSPYGSYLEAGCIYSAIFGEPSSNTAIILDKVWNYRPGEVDKEYTINESDQATLWKIVRKVQ